MKKTSFGSGQRKKSKKDDENASEKLESVFSNDYNQDMLHQELIFGIKIYRNTVVSKFDKTTKEFKLCLGNLNRLFQLCRFIVREHLIKTGMIHKSTDLKKDMRIKLQKYFEVLCNYMIIQDQKQYQNLITNFLKGKDEYFEIEIVVVTKRLKPFAPDPKKFKKIQYPNGQNGYQYRNPKQKSLAQQRGQVGKSQGKSEISFAESDFACLDREDDEKYKDIHCNITFESISIAQTTEEDSTAGIYNLPLDDEEQPGPVYSVQTSLCHQESKIKQDEFVREIKTAY